MCQSCVLENCAIHCASIATVYTTVIKSVTDQDNFVEGLNKLMNLTLYMNVQPRPPHVALKDQ